MVRKLYFALLKILQKRQNMLNRISDMNGRFASAIRAFFVTDTGEICSILLYEFGRKK